MDAVILAGGKGTRMRPYTEIIPKPLLPLGDKAIIEVLMDQLSNQGFKRISIAVGHQAHYMESFLKSKSRYNGKIHFSVESEPLGTAGPIKLLENILKDDFIVVNGDTLSDINYADLLSMHKGSKNTATIALFEKETKIDLGIIELDGMGRVRDYIEKPTLRNLVSTGVYAFNRRSLKYIGKNERLDFPELVKRLIKNKEPVGSHTHYGLWMDLGRRDDYEEANEIYEKNRHIFE